MIKALLLFLLLTILLTLGVLYALFSPTHASFLHYQGFSIHIDRDQHAIPHIQAPNRRSFLYAWGTVLAEDRLFQITFRQRFGQGRLSEFLGQNTLPADILMRDLGIQEVATHVVHRLKTQDPEAYADLEAFVDGINDQVARRIALPIQFHMVGLQWHNWTVDSTYLLFKMVDFSTTFSSVNEYARSSLISHLSKEEAQRIIPNTYEEWAFKSVTVIKDEELHQRFTQQQHFSSLDFDPIHINTIIAMAVPQIFISGEGSNSWVVSGKHTHSGKPIVSGDPHLDATIPSNWYQLRASYQQNGKQVNFAGVAIPGVPLAYGKTDYLASAITVIYTDTQDLYKQKIEQDKYLVDGVWRDLRYRNESIWVKSKQGLREHQHTVRLTHRGPLLNYLIAPLGSYDLRNQTISISWTSHNADYHSLIACSRHIQITDFGGLKQFCIEGTSYTPNLNLIAATADGHIVYRQMGVNPIRRQVESGSFVKDGTTSEGDWLGYLSAEDRLFVVDPERGYIVAANNQAASSSVHNGYFKHTILTARADRLQQVLAQKINSGQKITNEFAKSLLFDTVDIYCRQILHEILFVVEEAPATHSDFDCDFTASSYQASMYQLFYLELWKVIKPPTAGNFSIFALLSTQQYLYNYVHDAFKGDKIKQNHLSLAWQNMKIELAKHFQTENHEKWLWGSLHKDVMVHLPLGLHPVLNRVFNKQAKGWGNSNTVNVGTSNKIEFGNFATTHRANFRSIFDFGGESWWIIDGGTSQNILSGHYDDQWKLFMEQKLLPLNLPSSVRVESQQL